MHSHPLTRHDPARANAVLALSVALTSGCASVSEPPSAEARRATQAPASAAVAAQAPTPPGQTDLDAVDSAEEPEPGPHFVSVFAGGTVEDGERNGKALGLDYSYEFQEGWEVGAFTEFVVDTDRSFAMGIAVVWNPLARLHLLFAPGAERKKDSWGSLLRLGAYYEFPIGGTWSLSPTFYHDWTDEGTHILGGVVLGCRL